jgi:hypothetical protein
VGVGDDQLHPTEAAGLQRAQERGPERGPERAVLGVADGEAEYLPPAVNADAGGHNHGLGDDPAVDPRLAVGGVEEHVGKRGVGQGSVPEAGHFGVEIGADTGDLELADAGVGAERLDQIVDRPGQDAVQVGLHHHREQRLIHPPPAFQQRREERPGPQLRDPQLQIPGRGRQDPRPMPVPLGQPRLGPPVRAGADHRRQLGLDQRLIDRARGPPDPVIDIGRLQRIQHRKQGRLVQGHRVAPLHVFLGGFTQRLTRWPLDITEARRQAQDLHHSVGRDRLGPVGRRSRRGYASAASGRAEAWSAGGRVVRGSHRSVSAAPVLRRVGQSRSRPAVGRSVDVAVGLRLCCLRWGRVVAGRRVVATGHRSASAGLCCLRWSRGVVGCRSGCPGELSAGVGWVGATAGDAGAGALGLSVALPRGTSVLPQVEQRRSRAAVELSGEPSVGVGWVCAASGGAESWSGRAGVSCGAGRGVRCGGPR